MSPHFCFILISFVIQSICCSSQCEYDFPSVINLGAQQVLSNNIYLEEVMELSFEVQMSTLCSCDYCELVQVGLIDPQPRLPLISLDRDTKILLGIFTTNNHQNEQYVISDNSFTSTISDGNWHTLYFKFSDQQRIFIYDGNTMRNVQNKNGIYLSSNYHAQTYTLYYNYPGCAGWNANIRNLCMNSKTMQPTYVPTFNPTFIPTIEPTIHPTFIPTIEPTNYPTYVPTYDPTYEPTYEPTTQPTGVPTKYPTTIPSTYPTKVPSFLPSKQPSNNPTNIPTEYPSNIPSTYPTTIPSTYPTINPTEFHEGLVGTETTIMNSENNDNLSVTDKEYLLFVLVGVAIILLTLCVCFYVIYLCKKRRKEKKGMENNVVGIELDQMQSISTDTKTMHETDTNRRVTDGITNETNLTTHEVNIELKTWLNSIGMIEYFDVFTKQGFGEQMSMLFTLTDNDLLTMGIQNLDDREKILLAINKNSGESELVTAGYDTTYVTTQSPNELDGNQNLLDDESDDDNDLYIKSGKTSAGGPETKIGD
eukprot:291766_1